MEKGGKDYNRTFKRDVDNNVVKPCDAKIQIFIKEYGFDEDKEFKVAIFLMKLAEAAYDNKLINDDQLEESFIMARDLNDAVIHYCPKDTISQLIHKYEFNDLMVFKISEQMDKIAEVLHANFVIDQTQLENISYIAYYMSQAFNPCSRTKIYRLKTYNKISEIDIDEELDPHLLDIMNANNNIEIGIVCSGHDCPTSPGEFYKGNFPVIGFSYIGNLSTEDVQKILNRIPDATVKYRPQIEHEENIVRLVSNKNITNYFLIKGTRKGSQKWWEDVTKIISTLK